MRRVDWNELDGMLSFAPGSKVLYASGSTDDAAAITTGEMVVACADGTIVVVTMTATAYVVPEQAPTAVRRRLRELGRLRR